VDEVDRGQFDQIETFDYASGCCFLVRREVLAVSGVFDNQYFLYYEDVDLSLRIKRSGFGLGLVPDAWVWHKNGGSSQGSGSELQNFYLTRNRLLFFSSWGNFSVKVRTWRLAWRLWRHGGKAEKIAAKNFGQRRFGKQLAI
jgi:GT2 family glycosyltransferase